MTQAGLQVIDISDPANPQRVGGYDTAGHAYGVAVAGNYAYVADADAGLQVIDISNPANPQRVGGYDTAGTAYGVAVAGNYAYVADSDAGLQILSLAVVPAALTLNNPGNSFTGSGAGLTGVNADQLDGQHGAFYQNATNLTSGTLADARLSANVALLNANQVFSGSNSFAGVVVMTNAANSLAGTFAGNGAGVTNIPFTALPVVPLTNNQSGVTLKGLTTVSNLSVTATNFVNYLVVSNPPALNGNAITDVNADQLDGQHGAFYQNATNLTSGKLADARLSTNVALLNADQSFTGDNFFLGSVGIGTANPGYKLSFASVPGDKISLYGSSGPHYGFGSKPIDCSSTPTLAPRISCSAMARAPTSPKPFASRAPATSVSGRLIRASCSKWATPVNWVQKA